MIVPVCEKYTFTIKEAAAYFNVGTKVKQQDDMLDELE